MILFWMTVTHLSGAAVVGFIAITPNRCLRAPQTPPLLENMASTCSGGCTLAIQCHSAGRKASWRRRGIISVGGSHGWAEMRRHFRRGRPWSGGDDAGCLMWVLVLEGRAMTEKALVIGFSTIIRTVSLVTIIGEFYCEII